MGPASEESRSIEIMWGFQMHTKQRSGRAIFPARGGKSANTAFLSSGRYQRQSRPAVPVLPTVDAPRFSNVPWILSALVLGTAFLFASNGKSWSESEPIYVSDQPAQPPAELYRLGPQDRVKVRIFEWRASKDEIFAWKALNEEYAIGPTGRIAVPLLGEITAAGLTTEQLARRIAHNLQRRMMLSALPSTTVEIVQYRPFYVVGMVEKPGEYPFRPGMTLLQAVGLSGGYLKGRRDAGRNAERDSISGRGELQQLSGKIDRLIARRARLDAELNDDAAFKFPVLLTDREEDPIVRRMLTIEREQFRIRREAFETQRAALQELKTYLQSVMRSLASQMSTHQTQIDLMKDERDKVSKLRRKGLSTSPRLLSLERSLAQLEGEKLRLQSSIARVRQDVSRTDIKILQLQHQRRADLTKERQQAQADLEDMLRRRHVVRQLVFETDATATLLARVDDSTAGPAVRFKIVRDVNGKSVEIEASETTRIKPGDTVKVQVAPVRAAPESDLVSTPKRRDGGQNEAYFRAHVGTLSYRPVLGGIERKSP